MPRLRSAFVFLVSLLIAAPGFAQKPAPTTAIPADFNFAGTFDCEGNFRNGSTHKSIYTGALILDGKWLELTEKDTEPSNGYVAKYLIGYDAQQKQLTEFDANNFSAAVYTSEEGWKNKTLIMTSAITTDVTAPYAINRFLYTLVSADVFTVDWQISKTAVPNWLPSDHLSCKRHI